MLLRLAASAAVLLIVVGMKLAAPESLRPWQERFAQAANAEMDTREVFSAVGRAVSGEGAEPWQEVFQAVFSQTEVDASGEELQADAVFLATEDRVDDSVCMTQQILDFDFCPPLEGVMTSPFGWRESPVNGESEFHYAVDLAAEEGTEILAFAEGKVRAVGDSSSLGHYLILDHASGYSTLYAHCSRIAAAAGSEVSCGETIAEVGQSGNATGPHLHFQIYRGSTYLNPVYYL